MLTFICYAKIEASYHAWEDFNNLLLYAYINKHLKKNPGCYISLVLAALELGRLLSCLTGRHTVTFFSGTALSSILHLSVFGQRQERGLQPLRLKVCHLSMAASVFSLLA